MLLPTTISLPLAYLITLCGALTLVGGVSLLRVYSYTTPLQGRKLMHLATGPVFILCWLLFPMQNPLSRYIAASVPLTVAMYMLANARGWIRNRGLIETVSRSGRSSELQGGPFYYGLIHTAACAIYWLDSPIAIVSLLVLCIGDGIADLIGRPYGRRKWVHNREKSLEGSMAFFVGSWIVVYLYMYLFMEMGFFQKLQWSVLNYQLPLIVLASAFIESLPLGAYDNIGVFVGVVVMGKWISW